MKKILLYIMCVFVLFSACRRTQVGATSGKESVKLQKLILDRQMPTEEKYHVVCETFADLVEGALAKSDVELANDVVEFEGNNYNILNTLAEEFDDWLKNMSDEERPYVIINLVRTEQAQRLNRLVPLMRRRLVPYPDHKKVFEKLLRTIEMRR